FFWSECERIANHDERRIFARARLVHRPEHVAGSRAAKTADFSAAACDGPGARRALVSRVQLRGFGAEVSGRLRTWSDDVFWLRPRDRCDRATVLQRNRKPHGAHAARQTGLASRIRAGEIRWRRGRRGYLLRSPHRSSRRRFVDTGARVDGPSA